MLCQVFFVCFLSEKRMGDDAFVLLWLRQLETGMRKTQICSHIATQTRKRYSATDEVRFFAVTRGWIVLQRHLAVCFS